MLLGLNLNLSLSLKLTKSKVKSKYFFAQPILHWDIHHWSMSCPSEIIPSLQRARFTALGYNRPIDPLNVSRRGR
jgi:hypothetical protein